MTTLTRRYRFAASHRLHLPRLSATENAELYGKCNNPYGHGHDYVLEVTAIGEVDSVTGLLISVPKLDELVRRRVLDVFASRNINLDVPQFEHLVATTENIALVVTDLLQQYWASDLGPTAPRLYRVQIRETDRNGFENILSGPAKKTSKKSISQETTEGISLHA